MANRNLSDILASIVEYFKDLLDLSQDKERDETTIEEISRGVVFRGPQLWILLFAIIIASVGLNVNSTAVIIGAMLISPLMGPIMGVGLGAGINDFALIKKAAKNLTVATVLCIFTSAAYFYITPLEEAQSELLARTQPTLWDVMIAFFGGLAGIVAGSRKEKSNAIPGVAIATALMPPLCTAGYGLANGNWYYLFGALYLYFINGVFISFATFLIVRVLKYPKKAFASKEIERRVRSSIMIFVFCTAIPSIYLAYGLVKRTIFEQNALNFINTEFNLPLTEVINQKLTMTEGKGVINLTLYGKSISEETLNQIRARKSNYKLGDNVEIVVKQGNLEEFVANTQQEFSRMGDQLKASIIEQLYQDNTQLLKDKDERIKWLEEELLKSTGKAYPVSEIKSELAVQYPAFKDIRIGDLVDAEKNILSFAILEFSGRPPLSDRKRITAWLKVKVKNEGLQIEFK